MIHTSCVLAVGFGVGDFGDWSPMKNSEDTSCDCERCNTDATDQSDDH